MCCPGFDHGHRALHLYTREMLLWGLLRADAVVRAIHAAGGLAVLAHPARHRLGHDVLIYEAAAIGIDGESPGTTTTCRPFGALHLLSVMPSICN